jgi:predicted methyltransferase
VIFKKVGVRGYYVISGEEASIEQWLGIFKLMNFQIFRFEENKTKVVRKQ